MSVTVSSRVAVVTDSVACLPHDLLVQNDIHVIPVRIAAGGREYRDNERDLPESLIRKFQRAAIIDTTPWPPEHYCRVYEDLAVRVSGIVHVVPFARFTSTISLARAGAVMAEEKVRGLRVEVIDSAAVGMTQGFVALAAAHTAARGANMEEILLAAGRVRSSASGLYTFDTLSYLARTGRINRMAAWAGSLLNVIPIVGLSGGTERSLGLVRSKQQAARRLLDLMRSRVHCGDSLHVAVEESGRYDEAVALLRSIEEQLCPVESMVVRVSPVTQVVAGPGLLGIAFYCDR